MGKNEPKANAGESKKPESSHQAPAANSAPVQAAKPAAVKLGCQSQGCKGKDVRFSFCEEHFKQFKFGLIKKNGEPVSDYEKKFEHYQHWLKAQKVA
jgi:hypothetical protein